MSFPEFSRIKVLWNLRRVYKILIKAMGEG